MPSIDSLDSTVARKITISGPAIERLDRRKEDNNNPKMTTEKLQKNLKKVSGSLFRELKKISEYAGS
jgi:hypothetical protein